MIDELAKRIWSHETFHADAAHLRSSLLRARYVDIEKPDFDEQKLFRLLKSSVVLAASRVREHRQAAYQIATAATELEAQRLEGIPFVLLFVTTIISCSMILEFTDYRTRAESASFTTRGITGV